MKQFWQPIPARSAFLYALGLCAVSATLPVMAQTSIPPTTSSPGAIIQSIQQPGALQPNVEKKKNAPEVKQEEPQAEHLEEPSLYRKFFVKEIQVEGVTLLDLDKIDKLVSEYENKENSFKDLQGLTQKLTTLYRDKGYITTLVYIPPQKITNGTVILKAAEGLTGEITLEGERFFNQKVLLARIDLEKNRPFQVNDLKRSIRRIEDNPDINLQATLRASAESGKTDVILKAQDRFPIHATPFYDNLGRRLIGEDRFGVNIAHNNIFGVNDRSFTSLSFTHRSLGVVEHYEMPLGKHGTKFQFDYALSRLNLGEEFRTLKVDGRATTFSPSFSQELYNGERFRASMDVAFDFKNLATDILGEPFSRDRLRVLRPGFNFQEFDRFGNTSIRHEFGIGLHLFHATTGHEAIASRTNAGSKFFRYTGSITRVQKMPLSTYAIFRAQYQLTPDLLVSAEQFQVGGTYTVRGYKEGRLIGDQGYIFSGEWRAPFFIVPKSWKIPRTNYRIRDNVQFIAFTDFGSTNINKPAPGVDRNEYIISTGIGIRARLTRFLVGRIDMGIPLLRQIPDTQRARLHFGLQSEIF